MAVTNDQLKQQIHQEVNVTPDGNPDPVVTNAINLFWELYESPDRPQLNRYWLVRRHGLMAAQSQLRILMDTTTGTDSAKASQLFAQVTQMLTFTEGQITLIGEHPMPEAEAAPVLASVQLKSNQGAAKSGVPHCYGKPTSRSI